MQKQFLLYIIVYQGICHVGGQSTPTTIATVTPTSHTSESTTKSVSTQSTTTAQSVVDKYGGLGLVVDSSKIEIKRGIENLIIGISYPVATNLKEINSILTEIDRSIKSISSIPALKLKKYSKQVNNSLMAIHDDLVNIQKVFFDMSQYADKQIELDPKYDCHLEYSLIDEEYIKDLQIGITSFLSRLDMGLTDSNIQTDKTKLDNLITTILLIKDYIDQSKNELDIRVTELDSITLGDVPPGLPYVLETLACVHSGQIELITLNYCVKCDYGVFCQLELNSIASSQEYIRFEPINYEGAQIRFETLEQSLLLSSEGNWELLSCSNEVEDQYDELELLDELLECTTHPIHSPCIDALFGTDYITLLEYCNFTYRLEPRVVTRTQTGVLIMDPLDKSVSIREISGTTHKTKNNLPQKFPVHIVTNDDISVTTGEKEIVLKPVNVVPQRKISYSYLSQDFISDMQNKAKTQDSWEQIELEHIIGISLAIILFIIGTIAITLCGLKIEKSKICTKSYFNRNRPREMHRIARNLVENRRLLKAKNKESRV